ncbi:hypothetical protein Nstercoris_00160 [Nitrosomonas stercoris]|uniref:Uncharacterized protein n=1 Tax=Nitrosomonas stercoris TaxID=1444684 RepID=A0A4Y1YLY0_9PROT|nr:hypothetical protein Nstercoris_00160 [Nitrosomonas stercoris]
MIISKAQWHNLYEVEDEDEQSNIARDGDILIAPRLIMDARQVRTRAHTRASEQARQQYINRMFGDQRPVAATDAREAYIKRLRRAC